MANHTLRPEAALLDYTERLARFTANRIALHIHLSKLHARNRKQHHVRIAASTFEALVKPFEGQIFVLSNADIIFICKGGRIPEIDRAVARVRQFFSEDPLLGPDANEQEKFSTIYDLEASYPEFIWTVRKLADEARKQQEGGAGSTGSTQRPREATLQPIEPADLAKVESALAGADVSNMLRRQPVCSINGDGTIEVLFSEVYVSIGDLQRTIAPTLDLAADRWLFQRLTAMLDRRVLSLLQHNYDSALASRISLNLNVNTVLSPEFLTFDNGLRVMSRGSIVIEMQPHDIYADIGAFAFAHDFLHDREYKICIDGITLFSLRYINRQALGADYLKLFWMPDLAEQIDEERLTRVRNLIQEAGRENVILCRCDSEASIKFGIEIGVKLFQGRFIDTILQRRKKKKLEDLRQTV